MIKKRESVFGKLQDKVLSVEYIDRYFEICKLKDTSIADEMYSDLNIEDLFYYLNRCISPVGDMILYNKLRHLSTNTNLDKDESVIENICNFSDYREKIELILTNLSKKISASSISNLLNFSISLSKWHKYIKCLPFLYLCVILLLLLFGKFAVLIIASVLILTINCIIHYWNKLYVNIYITPLTQLLRLKTTASEISNQLDDYYNTEEIKESIATVDMLEKKMHLFTLNKFIESDFGVLLSLIIEFFKMIFLIEPIIISNISDNKYDYGLHSKRLIRYVGEWDVLFSNASLRSWLSSNKFNYSKPLFNEQERAFFKAREVYNPLIINCIPNDIELKDTMIITGSNMSGKSTFLRTIGVNIISIYALNICFASSINLFNCKLYTILSVSDDINSSKSYFFSEVERVKFALDMCSNSSDNRNNIVLIDEIFKGTNTIERVSIANAVIKYFINLKDTIVIVSTHDIELAKSFAGLLEIFHFDESINNGIITNDYKIKLGLDYNRNAITLLEQSNYPADIIACAKQNASFMEKELDFVL